MKEKHEFLYVGDRQLCYPGFRVTDNPTEGSFASAPDRPGLLPGRRHCEASLPNGGCHPKGAGDPGAVNDLATPSSSSRARATTQSSTPNGDCAGGGCEMPLNSQDSARAARLEGRKAASEVTEGDGAARTSTPTRDPQLFEAVRQGRWVEARRRVRELEQSGASLDQVVGSKMLERINRIGAQFEDSLGELNPAEGVLAGEWTTEHDDLNDLDFAFRLADSTMQVVASAVFTADALKAFVGLCEYDLCMRYSSEIMNVKPLREFGIDSIWNVRRRAHGGKEDNIVQVSCLDALDEPLEALWFCVYTPGKEGLHELNGVRLPPPRDGAVRLGYWRNVFAIKPLWTDPPSFRITLGLHRRTSAAAYVFAGVMRREVGSVLRNFREFVDTCSDLTWRSLFSRQAPFYDSVSRHLAECARARAVPPPRSILSMLSFKELTQHLPEDWADRTDVDEVLPREQG